jgi:hypothetical protein
LPVDASSSITFTLNGYQPETEKLEAIGEPPRLRPNPVVVEFSPASPSTAKKPAKPAAKKPATRPKAAAAPAPAPMIAAPTQAPSSPWPTYLACRTPIRSPCPFYRRGLRGRSQILDAIVNISQNSYIRVVSHGIPAQAMDDNGGKRRFDN